MNFGDAIKALKDGELVRRKGWNGKNMFVYFVPGGRVYLKDLPPRITEVIRGTYTPITMYRMPILALKTAHDELQYGWVASQKDMLSTDWEVIPQLSNI